MAPQAAAGAQDQLAGLLLIDKPAGITSHDVVARIRSNLNGVKTGHAGTLDPFATGLLIVMIGRATRMQQQIMAQRKRYEVLARLGALSSTGDPEGQIELTGRIPPAGGPLPEGELLQRPPIYSAVKIAGERAYRRARRGESFQMPPRQISVYRFIELGRSNRGGGQSDPESPAKAAADAGEMALEQLPQAEYLIECSAGTYVRSLIADLKDGYCLQLRRTRIGPFSVEDAIGLPERDRSWRPEQLIGLDQALSALAG